MLDVLVASRAPRPLAPRWLVASVIVHLALFALALESSRVESTIARPVMADTTLIFLPRLAPPPVREPVDLPRPVDAAGGTEGGGALVIAVDPPPRGFRTVVAPTEIPTVIPPVDLTATPLDPRDFTGRGTEGGVAWGVAGGTGSPDQPPPGVLDDAGGTVYAATFADARFEPAQLLSQPTPRYPPIMEAAGISGRVVLQFIVDTTGAVERPSITVVESTHEAFEEPARESAARAVFRPAMLGQRPVRQLSRQPISFVATR